MIFCLYKNQYKTLFINNIMKGLASTAMKVVIINDYAYINGGAAMVAVNIAKRLAARGVDTCFFSGASHIDEDLEKEKLKILCLNQHDLLSDPNRLRAALCGLYNPKARKAFEQTLEEYDPQETIIHAHSVCKILTSSCLLAAKEKGFKVVYHLHDYGLACPNLAFYHFGKRAICQRKPLSLECLLINCDARCYAHKLWRCARQFVQAHIARVPYSLDGIIYISQFSYRIMKPFLAPQTKRFFLPNYVDRSVGERVKAEENTTFVFVGRLTPGKNPVLLAKTAQTIGVPVTFVGDGILANDILCSNPNAEITGWIDSSKVSDYLKKARCLVFPSVWYETQGLVVVEALQMGIPVITSNACAATDMVVDGENGFVFQSQDENSLTEAMTKLLEDKEARRLSEGAWRLAADNDDSEAYIDKLLDIYEDVLDR